MLTISTSSSLPKAAPRLHAGENLHLIDPDTLHRGLGVGEGGIAADLLVPQIPLNVADLSRLTLHHLQQNPFLPFSVSS